MAVPPRPKLTLFERRIIRMATHSCFPAGTPVLTIAGPQAIESIRPGDRVLTQDPQSGELAFECVQGTTLRPAAPLVKFTIGSQSLSSTKGHPFWAVGQGWRYAKHVKPGDRLHSFTGAVLVNAVEEERPAEAYNLVVSNQHDYFVGSDALLVHDNSPLPETTTLIPGLPTEGAH